MLVIKETERSTARQDVMARLAREIGRGRDAVYHGTRHAPAVLREGKLKGPDLAPAVFFSRSPEIAAYWALRMGMEIDKFLGAVLVLDRGSLIQSYRLEPSFVTRASRLSSKGFKKRSPKPRTAPCKPSESVRSKLDEAGQLLVWRYSGDLMSEP